MGRWKPRWGGEEGGRPKGDRLLTRVSRTVSESQANVTEEGEETQVGWAEISRDRSQWEAKVKGTGNQAARTFALCPPLGSNQVLGLC